MGPKEKLIFALDVVSMGDAKRLLDSLAPGLAIVKIGKTLLAVSGVAQAAGLAAEYELRLMLDNKEIDVVSTLKHTAEQYAGYDLFGFTVMAAAGSAAISAMVEKTSPGQVIAVTVPTSMDDDTCRRVFGDIVGPTVRRHAREAVRGNAQAIVCSPTDAVMLSRLRDVAHLRKITPNVRPEWAPAAGQNMARSMTPLAALSAASNFLVIGSPIYRPPSNIGTPLDALNRILDEMATAMK